MEQYQLHCTNCDYKFTPKKADKMPENCPYCNTPESLEKEKTAQDLLDEVRDNMSERGERD